MVIRDRRLQLAIGITVLITVAIIGLSAGRDADDVLPIVVGLVALMGMSQIAVLFWGNRQQQSPLVVARREFLRGNFDLAAQVLEENVKAMREQNQTPDSDMLTLLGNTYRQLNRLDDSETCLRESVSLNPTDKLGLYGLGRTLLVKGDYQAAADCIDAALNNGARKVVKAELALARYYDGGNRDQIVKTLQAAARLLNLENYRALLVNYLLYNELHEQSQVNERELITTKKVMKKMASGMIYWEKQAAQYADTDYGRRLAQDVATLKTLLEEQS
jgi:tetratricopeptide (TPR) repeat protein